jgi:hypothetical protein
MESGIKAAALGGMVLALAAAHDVFAAPRGDDGAQSCTNVCSRSLAPFPDIRHWNTLTIELTRTACFGKCPDYSVEIHGDGAVVFTGRRFVAHTGVYRAHISRASVRALFAKFREADYFSLPDSYRAGATDLPTYTTSIAFDGHEKHVRDYGGNIVGMPYALGELERAVDEAADTDRWVKAPDAPP